VQLDELGELGLDVRVVVQLVDHHFGSNVCGAGRRRGVIAQRRAAGRGGVEAVGDVLVLVWERGEARGGGRAVGLEQGEVFAVAVEAEVGVKLLARDGLVLARGEDEQVAPGGDGDVGEHPFE